MVRSCASGEVPTRRTAWVPCQPWMQHHLDPRRRSTSPPTPAVVPSTTVDARARPAAPAAAGPAGPGPTDAGAGRPGGHARGSRRQAVLPGPARPPRRRRGGGHRWWPGAALLDPLRPVARRGADRQHRRLPAPRDPLVPQTATAPRRSSTSCSTSGWSCSGPRTSRCGPCPGCSAWSPLPLAWLAGRRLAGRTGAWAALLLVATLPVRRPLRHRDPHVLAGRPVDGVRLPGPRPGPAPAPGRQPGRRRRRVGPASLHPLLVDVPGGHRRAVAGLPGLAGPARLATERPRRWWRS